MSRCLDTIEMTATLLARDALPVAMGRSGNLGQSEAES